MTLDAIAALATAAVALGLYVLLWAATSTRPLAAKLLVRAVLPLLVIVPVLVLYQLGTSEKHASSETAGAPRPEMEGGSGRRKSAEVPRDGDTTARDSVSAREPAEPRPEPAEATDDEPAAAAPESGSAGGPGAPAATEAEAPPPRRTRGITTAPSPAVPPPPTTMSGAEPAGGPDATLAPPPPAAAPAAAPSSPPPAGAAENKETFDIVPVFFGTDRQRLDNPKRVDYGYDRARKLDLGRALVTIPKVHQVPQIERPWVVKIPYFDVTIYEEAEDPARHFTMQEIKTLSREELLGLVRARLASSRSFKDHAFIFVHGFNTSFDHAVYRTAQVANDLKFDGAPFLYSWPSGGGVASYTYDRESSGQAEPFMRDFMTLVVKETGARAVSIIAHSMGNQPVLQVLRDLKRDMPDGVAISQIILAAPDVDRDNFENIAKEIRGLAKGVTLYVAANDRALGVSRRFYGGVPRAGDVPPTGPLVLPDIDTIDITAVSTDSLGLNHSSYAENNALLNDIALLIQTGERPPDKRIPILTRVPSAKGDYWRYPSVP